MTRRLDLAAMIAPLGRALMAMEGPLLTRHGLSMWGYAVLCGLEGQEVRTQAALARSIGADKTRIIDVLDELQEAGLINRRQDPADRRGHLLSCTRQGKRVRAAAQLDIEQSEDRLLARLPEEDRAPFLRSLELLATLPKEEIVSLADG